MTSGWETGAKKVILEFIFLFKMGGLTEVIVLSPDMWPLIFLNAVIDLKGRFKLSLTYLLI